MVVLCASALVSLAGTGLVLIGGDQVPPAPAVAARFPVATTTNPVDRVVAVRTVAAVDLFDGVDTAGGDPVRVRVVDVRSASPCWQVESLDFAEDVLLGKEVRLVVSARGRAPDGRLLAHVRLPGGQDFALTALAAGAALAGTEVTSELLAAETGARSNRRGLWANGCTPGEDRSPSSTGELPTSTASSVPLPEESAAPIPDPADPTTTTPPADVEQGVKVGKPCEPEGAVGVDRSGREVVCRRTLVRGLRWALR